ncbi:D-arabinono-1,4-lactone oxidase [Salinibacterium sp. SWN1162]|uniref:D-arabinono-1,4-lactone oxidase n=1 Tax=Salinibacterium sp. SWN1162 TaxID=2792053 RepID=UPI0018CDC1D6|nr:D-arabinono-1,4-lactone oxidase [Salinibacterium sp. SWN1162]MBH0010159.1 FAD-binding protein [Salinibacterium sp. SWN1162]
MTTPEWMPPAAASAASTVPASLRPGSGWRNWGRSESAHPEFAARPESIDEVIAAVNFARDSGVTVKAWGAGHSFTSIAATDGLHLDVGVIAGVIAVGGADGTQPTHVTLGAGTNLYELPALLEPLGLALANMGDIDRQTIAGAISTGTHGTGARFGGIATQVRGVTLVTAAGEVLRVNANENPQLLPAAALSLGALGILVDVTIECVPTFLLHAVERPEPAAVVLDEWLQRSAETDHFEFFVWPHTTTALTKSNTRLLGDAPRHPLSRFSRWFDDEFMANGVFRAISAAGHAAPAIIPPINRLAVKLSGNREFTDVSTSVFVTDRTVRFREMEYALPLEAVPDAVRAIQKLITDRGWRVSFPIEVRSAAADSLLLSTASGRATGYVAVHRYWREDPAEYFREVEAIMMAHDGRPHWGKLHNRPAESLATAYPRFNEFLSIRDRLDPGRVFANDYLRQVLGQ